MSPSIFLSEEIDQKLIILKAHPNQKFQRKFFGTVLRNPYTLVVQTLYGKRVLGTPLSVRFHLSPKLGDAGKTRPISKNTNRSKKNG